MFMNLLTWKKIVYSSLYLQYDTHTVYTGNLWGGGKEGVFSKADIRKISMLLFSNISNYSAICQALSEIKKNQGLLQLLRLQLIMICVFVCIWHIRNFILFCWSKRAYRHTPLLSKFWIPFKCETQPNWSTLPARLAYTCGKEGLGTESTAIRSLSNWTCVKLPGTEKTAASEVGKFKQKCVFSHFL